MKKLLPIMLSGCILMSGCSNSAQNVPDSGKNSSQSVIDSVSGQDAMRDSENLKFGYDRPETKEFNAGVYNYVNAELSDDDFLELFSGEPSREKETFPNGFREKFIFGDEEGSILNRDGNLLVDYYTSQGFNFLVVEYDSQNEDKNTEFDFISRKELTEKLSSTVKNLLNIDIQIRINAVTAEQFSEDLKLHLSSMEELYETTPDAEKYGTPTDFYFVSFNQVIGGIPIEGSYGNAVFTAKGIEYLNFYNPWKLTEKSGNSNSVIDISAAEKLLKKNMSCFFLTNLLALQAASLHILSIPKRLHRYGNSLFQTTKMYILTLSQEKKS